MCASTSNLWIAGAVEAELCSTSTPWVVACRRIMDVPQAFDYSKGQFASELSWSTISYGARDVRGQTAIRRHLVFGGPVDDAGHGMGPAAPLWFRVLCLVACALRYLRPHYCGLYAVAWCSCLLRWYARPAYPGRLCYRRRRAVRAADPYSEHRARAPGHG